VALILKKIECILNFIRMSINISRILVKKSVSTNFSPKFKPDSIFPKQNILPFYPVENRRTDLQKRFVEDGNDRSTEIY